MTVNRQGGFRFTIDLQHARAEIENELLRLVSSDAALPNSPESGIALSVGYP